ncbi:hypothetical protein G5S35_22405 [Paraburkholderia tropica]|uniref:hypothetical protein n=1 Tax=Paraburkholderia tropica TaxID=92647 RepID=UPI001601ACDF|nr:hypothetical protein [Paraburkholderia tropica]QNB14293.1 hypothetical protein G5S35_22405 [Paraburkholderia tropica]
MSNKFFASGSNASFDISGSKQQDVPKIITDPNAPVHADRSTELIFDKDVTGEKIMVKRTFDLGDTIEQIKAWRTNLESKSSYGEEMRPVMEIPEAIVEQYCNIHGITLHEFIGNKEHIRRVLKDPDLAYFRLRPSGV